MIEIFPAHSRHVAELTLGRDMYSELALDNFSTCEQDCVKALFDCDEQSSRLIGVVGMHVEAHIGHVWSVLAENLGPVKFSLVKKVRFLIQAYHERYKILRMDMVTEVDPVFIRWGKVLGFEVEGTLRCYGPGGEDYLLQSRVWR